MPSKREVWVAKGFPWFAMPDAVIEDLRLTHQHRAVIMYLACRQTQHEQATLRVIADWAEVSVKTMTRILIRLRRLGWLTRRSTSVSTGGRPPFVYELQVPDFRDTVVHKDVHKVVPKGVHKVDDSTSTREFESRESDTTTISGNGSTPVVSSSQGLETPTQSNGQEQVQKHNPVARLISAYRKCGAPNSKKAGGIIAGLLKQVDGTVISDIISSDGRWLKDRPDPWTALAAECHAESRRRRPKPAPQYATAESFAREVAQEQHGHGPPRTVPSPVKSI